jgi:hypothetical protein
MPEKSILLSKLEREILTNPEGLDARQKRNLNYRLKTRCSQIDQALQEIRLLIETVPEDSIKESVSNKTLNTLMAIFENILQVLDPWPIGVNEDESGVMASKVFGNAIPSADPGKCTIDSISRTATQEEIEFDHRLTDHFNKIRQYVDPCTPDPICRNPEYVKTIHERILKTRNKFDGPFLLSESAYLDETGVSETGWVLRKPSMVDINQLQWMRWKPRELKECMEQPPLLEEKKIPTGPEIMHTRMECNAEGTRYLVSEKGGAERSVTLEEFLKIHEKYEFKKKAVEEPLPEGKEAK